MEQSNKAFRIFLSSPLTWMAGLTVILLEWGMIQWFSPSLSVKLIFLGVGVLMLLAWPVFFLRSNSFHQDYSKLPYEAKLDNLENILKSCPEAFQKPSLQCLELVEKIRQEFKSERYQDELNSILLHLVDLSQNHLQLHSRAHKFGTADQKQTMRDILQQQVQSVETSLKALKTFSGNLTLLAVQVEDQGEIANELKAINQGLQEAIQEI